MIRLFRFKTKISMAFPICGNFVKCNRCSSVILSGYFVFRSIIPFFSIEATYLFGRKWFFCNIRPHWATYVIFATNVQTWSYLSNTQESMLDRRLNCLYLDRSTMAVIRIIRLIYGIIKKSYHLYNYFGSYSEKQKGNKCSRRYAYKLMMQTEIRYAFLNIKHSI